MVKTSYASFLGAFCLTKVRFDSSWQELLKCSKVAGECSLRIMFMVTKPDASIESCWGVTSCHSSLPDSAVSAVLLTQSWGCVVPVGHPDESQFGEKAWAMVLGVFGGSLNESQGEGVQVWLSASTGVESRFTLESIQGAVGRG